MFSFLQDEVFSDDEIEDETDELTAAENEKNLMAVSPDSTSGNSGLVSTHPAAMLKGMPTGTSIGVDGITTVSINASVAPVMGGGQQPPLHHEIKKGERAFGNSNPPNLCLIFDNGIV